MSSYQPSKVHSRYGAPMGRESTRMSDIPVQPLRLSLQRVRLNQGGYDDGGAYWGHGAPLYVATDDADVTLFVRAVDRADAKDAIVRKLPLATFKR